MNHKKQPEQDIVKSLRTHQTELEQLVKERTQAWQLESQERQKLELQQVVEEERQRIAREIHDNILQSLLALRLRLLYTMRDHPLPPEMVETTFTELIEEVMRMAQDMRYLLRDWQNRNPVQDLPTALRQLTQRMEKTYQVQVHLEVAYPLELLTPGQTHHLLRIVQEATTNACWHGQAGVVWIKLTGKNGRFCLTIQDNGHGFIPEQLAHWGLGLNNMRRRAQLMGGHLRLTSRPNKGTTVQVEI